MTHHALALPIPMTCAVALAASACVPIPIPHTKRVTPAVVGEMHRSDGLPSARAAVALTASSRDRSCTRASIHGVTDSLGHFRVPAARQRRHVFWLTLVENPGRWIQYWLCAGAADSAGHVVYRSRVRIDGSLEGDSLRCVEWVWRERPRVTCERPGEQRIVTLGGWSDGETSGTYRMILAHDEDWGYGLRPYVQWLAAPGAEGARKVLGIAQVPADAGTAQLTLHRGRWRVVAITAINQKRLVFDLGPPGEVRYVPDGPR